jgi:hypothetical protein
MTLEAEAVNSASCITGRSPIIGRISLAREKRISDRRLDQAEFFNAIRRLRTF